MAYLSDFEHTKLEAHVFPGMVVQTHYISDSTTGQRRVPQTQIWKVERLLGKGGFGEVRLEAYAEEQRAVKRIWATGTTFKVEYERELKALLEFSKPKYKRDTESVYLAMEYVPNGDLEDNVKTQGGKIEEAGVKDIAMQILEGLKIMHLERFVHRDLKPKNVLVCRGPPHWWVKLADFGLSKRRTEDTALRTQTGTQAYMAPEILNYIPGHSEYTYAVDIWALGCIIYRLISGVVPFPPGLSLTNFCGDEKRFPSKALEMSDIGAEFVRKLIVAHPTKRLTAGKALDHAWIKPNPLTSDASLGYLIVPEGASNIDVSASFGAYNTVTHVGLQSYGTQDSTVTAKSPNAAAQPVNNYHPPTVEDAYEVDDNTAVASDLKGDVTGDEQDIQPDINTQSSSQQGPGCGPGTNSTPPLQQAEERVEKISESLRAALCAAEIRAGELEQAKRAPARSPVEHVRKARDKDRRRDAEAKHSRRYIMEDSSSGEERKAQLQLDADRNTPERVSSKKQDPRDYERGKLTREGPRRRQVWVEDESSDDELRRREESLRSDTAARARLYPGHPAEAPLDPKWAEHVNFAGAYMQAQQRKNSQRQPAAKGESSNTPLRNPPTMRRAETFSTSPDYNKAPMNERLSEHRGSVGKYMAAARRKVAHEEPQDTMSPVASTTPGNVRYGYAPDLPQHADEDGYLTPSYFAAAHRRNPSRHPGTRRAETFSPPQDPAYQYHISQPQDDEYDYRDYVVDGVVYRRYSRRPQNQSPVSIGVQNDESAPQEDSPPPITRKEYTTSEGTRRADFYHVINPFPPIKSRDLPRRSRNAPIRPSPPASRANLTTYEGTNRPYSDYRSPPLPIDDEDALRRSSARASNRSPSLSSVDEDVPRRSSAKANKATPIVPGLPKVRTRDAERRSSPSRNENKDKPTLFNPFQILSKGKSKKSSSSDETAPRRRRKSTERNRLPQESRRPPSTYESVQKIEQSYDVPPLPRATTFQSDDRPASEVRYRPPPTETMPQLPRAQTFQRGAPVAPSLAHAETFQSSDRAKQSTSKPRKAKKHINQTLDSDSSWGEPRW